MARASATRFIAEPLERRMLLSLVPAGAAFRVNSVTPDFQNASAIARDADGDFEVAWHSGLQDGRGAGVNPPVPSPRQGDPVTVLSRDGREGLDVAAQCGIVAGE